jgi:hypothetical protein
LKVSRKSALFGMLAAGVTGCAGATSRSVPGFFGAAAPSGKAPSDVFVVKKGRGAPRFSTRRLDATATSSEVYTYSDGGSGYSTQANKSTGAANLYAPNGAFAAQITGAAVSGGYAMTLAQANGNTYSCSMPDPNAVPTGQSTYNGVAFNIDANAGPSTATYRGMTITATYDSGSDTVSVSLPDGGVAHFPNVTYSASSGTTSAASGKRHTDQAARVGQALLCVVRIIIAIIVTIITILVIYAAIAICAAVSWTILGIIGCVLAVVVAIVMVVVTVFTWIYVWIDCSAIPPPPPAGVVPAQQAQPVPVAAAAA